MKYAIAALLLDHSQLACTTDTNTYTLSGSADGMADGSKVIIYALKRQPHQGNRYLGN